MDEESERIRQKTIRNAVAMMEELFDDTDLLSVEIHPRLPVDVMTRVHNVVRAASATGRAGIEVRTWISELQVTTGDQGMSWIRDWPSEDMRIRHVQLIEWQSVDGEKVPVVHWETPVIDIDAID